MFKTILKGVFTLVLMFNLVFSFGQSATKNTLDVLSKPYNLSSAQQSELKALIDGANKAFLEQTTAFVDSAISNKQQDFLKAKAQLEVLQKLISFDLQPPVFLNNDTRQITLVETAKKINFNTAKLNTIIKLFVEREFKLKEFEFIRSSAIAYANDAIDFHEHTYDVRAIHEDYSKKVADLISLEEYEALFKDSLMPIIENTSKKRIETIANAYNIVEDKHFKKLKYITDRFALKKIMIQHYYTFDHKKLHVSRVNAMFEESRAIDIAIQEFNIETNGFDLSSDARIAFFVERSKKAGISNEDIKKLVYAINDYNKKINKYYEDLAIWQSKYVIYYFHSAGSPEIYEKELKRQVSKIMTIDQFEKMFLHQFKGRIDVEANLRTAKLRITYRNLSSAQLQKLSDMIREQVKKERVIYEYYGYDHENAIQRLRASKYKFDKKYKETLKEVLN